MHSCMYMEVKDICWKYDIMKKEADRLIIYVNMWLSAKKTHPQIDL